MQDWDEIDWIDGRIFLPWSKYGDEEGSPSAVIWESDVLRKRFWATAHFFTLVRSFTQSKSSGGEAEAPAAAP